MLMLTPTTREIDRIEEPSTSIWSICVRLVIGSVFMPKVYYNASRKASGETNNRPSQMAGPVVSADSYYATCAKYVVPR